MIQIIKQVAMQIIQKNKIKKHHHEKEEQQLPIYEKKWVLTQQVKSHRGGNNRSCHNYNNWSRPGSNRDDWKIEK